MSSAPTSSSDTNTNVRLRCANIPNGSTGLAAVRCERKNPMSSTTPKTTDPITGAVKPTPPSVIPNTRSVDAPVAKTAPRTSRAIFSECPVLNKYFTPRPTMNTPMGTLMRKIQRQLASVKAPPTTSPNTDPNPVIMANTEKAWLRGFPGAKVTTISAMAVGDATAAPIPCITRATSSTPAPLARPQASDARVNMLTPMRNVRFRPNTSPSRPPRSSNPP